MTYTESSQMEILFFIIQESNSYYLDLTLKWNYKLLFLGKCFETFFRLEIRLKGKNLKLNAEAELITRFDYYSPSDLLNVPSWKWNIKIINQY